MKELRVASLEFGDWRARDFEDERLEGLVVQKSLRLVDPKGWQWVQRRETGRRPPSPWVLPTIRSMALKEVNKRGY